MRILLVLFLLSGCANGVCVGIDCYNSKMPPPGYAPLVVRVDDPHYTCKSLGVVPAVDPRVQLSALNITHEAPIYGCADPWGRIQPRACVVIVGKDAPQWVIDHELEHCDRGQFHPPARANSFPTEFWK